MVLVTELATGDFFDFMTDEFGTAQYWKALPLYAAEVLLGLEWMHRRGLLYRDLKPENLLMRADGHLVLSDFGMSTRLQPGQRATRVCGTAVYMSPEVLAEQGYGFMSELWSYGVLLYELFTGITPFLVEESSARSANELVADRIRRMTCQHTGAVLFDDSAYMNADAKHLITSLLQVDEATRLGAADDAGDYRSIKSHPWFANINWAGLEAGLYKPTITVPVNLPAEPDVLGLPWATGKPLTAKSSRDKFGAFCLSHTV
jgi:serine/threonine protein kinase